MENTEYSFDRNMWPNLTQISAYNRQAAHKMQTFQRFSMSVNVLVKKFADGLRKCTQTMESDMSRYPLTGFDDENDTLSLALQCVKSGVDTLSQNLDESIHQIIGDLVEPLETFTKLYQQETMELIGKAEKSWGLFQEVVKVSNVAKDKYFDLKWDVEKCEIQLEEAMLAHERGQVTIEKVQRISQYGTEVKYKAEMATQKYHDAIANVNKASKGLQKTYCPFLLKIQQSEESRINFFKNCIKKIMRHLATIGTKITSTAQHVQEQSEFVCCDKDLTLFIKSQGQADKLPTDDHQMAVYHSHVDIQKYKQELAARQLLEAADAEDSDEDGNGVMIYNDPSDKVKKIIYTLVVEGTPIGPEDTGYMLESCKLPEVRQSLGAFFRGVTTQRVIHKKECFVVLGWLCQAFIDQLDTAHNEDLHQLEGLMQMSLLVCMQEGAHKVYLSTEIDQNRIWQQSQIWNRLLQFVINFKINEAQHKPQEQNPQNKPQSHFQFAAGGLKMGFGALKGIAKNLQQSPSTAFSSIQTQFKTTFNPELPQVPIGVQQNIAYNTQSLFIKYFVNYHLSFDGSRNLILAFCKKFDFDKSRTHLLLSELESTQKNQNYLLTPKDRQQISLLQKTRRQEKFGEYLIPGLIIPFLNDDHCLGLFLRLDKTSHKLLKRTVYKHGLALCQPERLQIKRLPIWEHLLALNECTKDYHVYKEKVQKMPELIHNVEEVIMLDVQRSAHSMPCVNIETLISLLKTYAYYNPEIEYCQGMNYIAGFLLAFVKDEEVAFKILSQVADKYRMAELFNPDIPRLKLFFLQLDRMICFANTDLYTHFTNEDITSSYFASAWFITLFTNSLKQNHDADGICNESLLQVWDYFLITGWKAVLKLGLYILTMDQSDLVGKSFEQILGHISESPKRVLIAEREGTVYQMLKNEFKRIPMTFHLNRLQHEFEKSHADIPGKNKKK